jgi:hypothetical protein
MARNHSSVAYVEPNYTFSGLTAAANDGETYDRAPDLEDYCIALDIIVELSSRRKSVGTDMDTENKVIIMSYQDRSGEKSNVSFMSGSMIGGYESSSNNEVRKAKLNGKSVLTNYYADMYITDLVDYGTTEMLGIKSVDVEYNSTAVPVVTIKFTDVRGMSLFQPSELNDDLSFNGIRGFSKDNIAQSFFHSFFTLPIPKFTIVLKGFYGEPVSYQVMCDKFDTAFNSSNGNFDVTARFIGFAYSFMADVSFNALLAAPFSDYIGEKYWDSQVKSGRFTLPNQNGSTVRMPKLYEIRRDFETLMNDSDNESHDTTEDEESKTHEIEIQTLTKLRNMYKSWYDSLYINCTSMYGTDYCYAFGGVEDEDYKLIVIFTNGKNIKENDLSKEFLQYDESFRKLSDNLQSAIDEYNNSGKAYRQLDRIKENFAYKKIRTLRPIWYNNRKNILTFDGFHSDNILPRKEAIETIFGNEPTHQQNVLAKLYDDGENQYTSAFVIDLDYTDLKRRINSLIEDANRNKDDKIQKRKALNKHMYEKMGWYPTIENFTKIVMAHLETLMAMMYDVVDQTKSRTLSQLGIESGDSGVVDINKKDDNVAPFPRLTVLTTDADGYSKSEDAWAGNFTDGIGFKEVDMINGLFNGVSKIYELEKEIQAAVNNINSESEPVDNTAVSIMPMPLTSYDFVIKKNPYGNEDDITNSIDAFAGKVCMRMFGILSLNHFRKEHKSNWLALAEKLGKIEAYNFHKLNKIKNPKLMSAIGENGSIKNGEDIIKIVTGKGSIEGKLAWEDNNGNGKMLFSSGNMWLTKYRSASSGMALHPLQNMSFKKLKSSFNAINAGKYPIEDEDIIVIDSFEKIGGNNLRRAITRDGETSFFNTVKFTNKSKDIWEILQNAQSNTVSEYSDVANLVSTTIKPDVSKNLAGVIAPPSSDYPISFNRCIDEAYLAKPGNTYTIYGFDDTSLAYGGGVTKSEANDERKYRFSEDGYFDEMINGSIQSFTITESFGFKKVDGKYSIDQSKSFFYTPEYVNLSSFIKNECEVITSEEVQMAFFLMGLTGIKYDKIADNINNKSFAYIPNIASLQIGAVIAAYYCNSFIDSNGVRKSVPFTSVFNVDYARKFIVVPYGFEALTGVINGMSTACKLSYVKHFRDWCVSYKAKFNELKIKDMNKTNKVSHVHYEKVMFDRESGATVKRALFRQNSDVIKSITNSLMSMVGIINLTVASDGSAKSKDSDFEKAYYVSETQAKVYLDSFLKTLRQINGLEEGGGDPTTIAQNPTQTTEDMKIELYRYLKQIYDKWAAATTFDTWKFDQFFNEKQKQNPLGNNFFFIDSFYNKIGDKLLINPRKLSKIIKLATESMDTNVMLYSFFAQVYGEHRCMMKCIQNFKMLSDGINNLFVPVPYNSMSRPDPFPDFVVIYTYESSRNLNVANGEYKDDGFMLNDEYDTPLPIKSRGDEKRFYKIPAFGVSYGRQYQNYFKSVNVDMSNPTTTEQAIVAKHSILAASRDKTAKGVGAQDLYDIYSNQSYTCNVEMMGCAFVQPLMYFVLLNVPFFRGSYLISKVKHSLRPGDMTTTITGVRMSKYSNKIVTDIFTDEEDAINEGGTYNEDKKYLMADTTNDCPYQVFPIENDDSVYLSGSDLEKAKTLMDKIAKVLYNKDDCSDKDVRIAAAGIVGNMWVETLPHFDHTSVNAFDNGGKSGGLCQWRDNNGNNKEKNLSHLILKQPDGYGQPNQKCVTGGLDKSGLKNLFSKSGITVDTQIKFLNDTISNVTDPKNGGKFSKEKLLSDSSARVAAEHFRAAYERGNDASKRQDMAEKFFDSYESTRQINTAKTSKKPFTELFFNAVQKSLNSTGSYSGNLIPAYRDNDKTYLQIRIEGNDYTKLAVLFDIILNSPEYYNHVGSMSWVYKNSPSEYPDKLLLKVGKTVKNNERRIYVQNGGGNVSGKLNGDECNEKLMQSLGKKYGAGDKNVFTTECPQFSNSPSCLDKFKPTDCNTLFNGGTNNNANPSEISHGDAGSIDGWDVGKACAWIISHNQGCRTVGSETKCGVSKCASYVEDAIAAGGGPLKNRMSCGGNGHATNLRYHGILEKNGFVQIDSGTVAPRGNPNISLQAGDVAILGPNGGGKFHACLYTSSRGWCSDFIQNNMNVYSSLQPYAIYRFHNKKKS